MTRLADLAHLRTGDKGTRITISVSFDDPGDFFRLVPVLTHDRALGALEGRVRSLIRFELPNIETLLFVGQRDPDDAVTTSTHLDTHGKTLSSLLGDLLLPDAVAAGDAP